MSFLIFQNARIFDGRSPDQREGSIVVEGGRIQEVSPSTVRSDCAQIIDLRGKFVMPGLIDAHYHAYATAVDLISLDALPLSLVSQQARLLLEESLQRGFTTVRDAGGAEFGIARAIEAGLVKGPRLLFSGKALSQTGGHGDMRPQKHLGDHWACANYSGLLSRVVNGVDEVRRAVREEMRKGATQIKMHLSGGIASPRDPIWLPQFCDDEIKAGVREAEAWQTYVMAHAHSSASVRRAAELGVRSIEHATLMDAETAQFVAGTNSYVVPTLSIFRTAIEHADSLGFTRSVRDKLDDLGRRSMEGVSNAAAAGVKLGFGTDLIGELHRFQANEFRYRASIQTPFEVLRSATVVNAEILKRPGELGEITPGAYADLIVLATNPLEDISAFERHQTELLLVMKEGEVFKNLLI